ncbi:MAG: polysaccharide ABC transporter ATP-binding protein [Verrucomicrobiota bacterium]
MSDISIQVENLSKTYLVGHRTSREAYRSFRETIARGTRNFARKALDMAAGRPIVQGDEIEEFSALDDVSFSVRQGEVLGIIGHNGAGKSTLLKVLSRITDPSGGRVTLHGRVGSLLEVGTGFHPELSGRENIFLNGAILGMKRAEIRDRFDDIVDFAGVSRFLDTPVKRYSSGMYVRLAFSVAAHLQPEILIVDEVLAVGDAEFQARCLGKMESVARGGRTVLLVSHNLATIQRLADRALLLKQGSIICDDTPANAVAEFHRQNNQMRSSDEIAYRVSSPELSVAEVTAHPTHSYVQGKLEINFTLKNESPNAETHSLFLILKNGDGVNASSYFSKDTDQSFSLDRNSQTFKVSIDSHCLLPGKYTIEAGCFDASGAILVWAENLGELEVLPQMESGADFDGRTGHATQKASWVALSS